MNEPAHTPPNTPPATITPQPSGPGPLEPPVAGPDGAGRAPSHLDVPALLVYLGVAFGGAWLVALPLWLSGRGLETPGAALYLVAMMFTPSLATAAVVFGLRRRRFAGRRDIALRTGIRAPGGIRSWRRWGVLAWLVPSTLVVLSILLGAAVGVLRLDLTDFSGFRAVLDELGAPELPIPLGLLVALQVGQAFVVGWLNVIPALGEEWGWRGWLVPALRPLGVWPAIIVSGVIWGLWHAPVILLGYNYPDQSPAAGLALMVVFCVLLGALLFWVRQVSGSVWPAAIGHGFVNAFAGLPVLVAAADPPVDNAQVGLLGWTGWIVMAIAIGVAFRWRRLGP